MSQTKPDRFRFGAFEVDMRSGEVRKHGIRIKLHRQPFHVLAILLEHRGQVVTREQLRIGLWSADTFVAFNDGLDVAIYKLRTALGDSAENPRFLETLPRRGYRFIAPVEEQFSAAKVQKNRALRPFALAGLAALVLVVLAGLYFRRSGNRSAVRTDEKPVQSLAVLPLQNLSGDPSQEYFADGMTEELTTDLGKIEGLRVISRTSAMHYKSTRKTVPDIARELGVDAVIEGTVERSGNRVRVTAQLVKASEERHLWAESYERDLGDALALQDEVARDIAIQIRLRLTPADQIRLSSARRIDPQAQEAYLRGRYEWGKWSAKGLTTSIDYFKTAIQIDPGYAEAWSGLSDSYFYLSLFGVWPREVALPQAKDAALKALSLDETLSAAHVSLANMNIMFLREGGSLSAADKELRRAIDLSPSNAIAHQTYGYQLTVEGKLDAAIAEMKLARELDPLSPNTEQSLAATYLRAAHYDEALQGFSEIPDGDLNSERRHRKMAFIYERKGMEREALSETVLALRLAGKKELAESVERKYASSGYLEAKKTFLSGDPRATQLQQAKRLQEGSLLIAADYALLGEKRKTFEWLHKALKEHDQGLMYLNVDYEFEAFRSDPQFQDILRRIGLPS